MRVVVYPHELAIGGSQINAIDLAAAGRAAVINDLPSARTLSADLVVRCPDAPSFVRATADAMDAAPDAALAQRRRDFAGTQSWAKRADDFSQPVGLPPAPTTSSP